MQLHRVRTIIEALAVGFSEKITDGRSIRERDTQIEGARISRGWAYIRVEESRTSHIQI